MILTGIEIEHQVNLGRIQISPFSVEQINPNSYDFRLGDTIKIYENDVLDTKIKQETIMYQLPTDGMLITTDRIYLGCTYETMGSDYYVPIIRAKSSIARIGLFIHVTADLIDIGSHNQWTLQLHAVQPLKIYPRMLVGQVTFWTVEGQIELYHGKYQGAIGPQPSLIYNDFNETF